MSLVHKYGLARFRNTLMKIIFHIMNTVPGINTTTILLPLYFSTATILLHIASYCVCDSTAAVSFSHCCAAKRATHQNHSTDTLNIRHRRADGNAERRTKTNSRLRQMLSPISSRQQTWERGRNTSWYDDKQHTLIDRTKQKQRQRQAFKRQNTNFTKDCEWMEDKRGRSHEPSPLW